ncbi:hypothetical protein HB779_07010 [Phyllobacterium sp. 628]|uniref:MAE_28990/MAE_18760 family HEPN-like nuclease n=1 Tax=Phyllobacterium sp. 628 TaxID=2718938 RepID=UPI0016624DE8|nr:MAE_28990/MAE_18760 family HEPN-like nuclease [Phyllobacterium sp. 628]QND51677.1 hypothetical protein HB779_07010 [Phyllobacterium sp. 628]
METIEEITIDLSWRETELGLLKILLQRSDTKKQQEVLSRAAWALLYAHYEGFCKFCLTVFFDRATKALASCHGLPLKTRSFALDKDIKRLKNLPADEFLESLENFANLTLGKKPQFPEVDTKSNLWPNVLEELLKLADINCPAVDTHRQKIKTLVTRRNNIAHGKADDIGGYNYYVSFEDSVYEIMYELAFEVDQRLRVAPYV